MGLHHRYGDNDGLRKYPMGRDLRVQSASELVEVEEENRRWPEETRILADGVQCLTTCNIQRKPCAGGRKRRQLPSG